MTKSEMQMIIQQQETAINVRKNKIKEQNRVAAQKWDCVSCRLPKGTKKRIEQHGLTVNGIINSAVLAELDRMDHLMAVGPEEVQPDKWDLQMIDEARQENDGTTISFDELLKKDGLTYADLQN